MAGCKNNRLKYNEYQTAICLLVRYFYSVFHFTATNTVEGRVDVRTILDRTVYPMEYRVGSAHAHDANPYLSGTNVRVESGKGKYY